MELIKFITEPNNFLQAHDKIKVISQVDAEWLYGQVVGRPHLPGGIFPVNFVDRLPSSVCQTPSKIKSSAAVASKKSASKVHRKDYVEYWDTFRADIFQLI